MANEVYRKRRGDLTRKETSGEAYNREHQKRQGFVKTADVNIDNIMNILEEQPESIGEFEKVLKSPTKGKKPSFAVLSDFINTEEFQNLPSSVSDKVVDMYEKASLGSDVLRHIKGITGEGRPQIMKDDRLPSDITDLVKNIDKRVDLFPVEDMEGNIIDYESGINQETAYKEGTLGSTPSKPISEAGFDENQQQWLQGIVDKFLGEDEKYKGRRIDLFYDRGDIESGKFK